MADAHDEDAPTQDDAPLTEPVDRSGTLAPTVLGDVLSSTLARVQASMGNTEPGNPLPALVGSVLSRLAVTPPARPAPEAVVDLERERELRRPAPSPESVVPSGFDVRALVDQAVTRFARSRLAQADGAHARVIIDGDYVARHGSELVPAILAHLAERYVALLSGTTPVTREAAEEPAEAEIDIQYDFSDIVRALVAQHSRG